MNTYKTDGLSTPLHMAAFIGLHQIPSKPILSNKLTYSFFLSKEMKKLLKY